MDQCLQLIYSRSVLPPNLHGFLHLVGDRGEIKINNTDPVWRQRLAFSHELWHLMDHKWSLNLSHEHVHQWAIGSALAEVNDIPYEDISMMLKLVVPKHIFLEHMQMFKEGKKNLSIVKRDDCGILEKDKTMYDVTYDKKAEPLDFLEKLMSLVAEFQVKAAKFRALYERHLVTEAEYQGVMATLGKPFSPVVDNPTREENPQKWTEARLASLFPPINAIMDEAKKNMDLLTNTPEAEVTREILKAKAVRTIAEMINKPESKDYSFDISSII